MPALRWVSESSLPLFSSLTPKRSSFAVWYSTHTDKRLIISQKTTSMCHISEERSFYVDYRNITFEMIFVSSHSSEWSKNTSTMQKKSFSTPKMHFWWSFSLVSCSTIPNLYIFVQKPFIWLLISLQGTIKTIWYGFTNLL